MQRPADLDFLFHPQSVAVVGVSADFNRANFGREFFLSLLNGGYQGQIYLVGLEGEEVFGQPLYHDIKDVPGNVDYVISAVPARYALQLVEDSAVKGVKAMHFFTAGFGELGQADSKAMEEELASVARRRGIRIIGPNCMGIFCPETGLAFQPDLTRTGGTLGMISQSGGNAGWAIREGAQRGVFFSKLVSYGNAADLNETDLLEYMVKDQATTVIAMYIEGVKDGRRFFHALKWAARRKPVIIYKGGNSDLGERAAASHTGSLSGSGDIWAAAIHQAGAIPASGVDEIVDLAVLFRYAAPLTGSDTAIVGIGGGNAVMIADIWEQAGLAAPPFPAGLQQKFRTMFKSEAGSSFKNPFDMMPMMTGNAVANIIDIILGWRGFDLVLLHLPLIYINNLDPDLLHANVATLASMPPEIKRRIIIMTHLAFSEEEKMTQARVEQEFYRAGFATFPCAARAAQALSRFIEYHRRR